MDTLRLRKGDHDAEKPSPHAPGFQRQIIEPSTKCREGRLVRLGRTAADLAREFEPTYETIRLWIRKPTAMKDARPIPNVWS